jgi:2-phospho-L-lactate transferase/gluconeogenesis factor (CofD/UPF0052 family)
MEVLEIFFFTGARLFFNSLETAIFWFGRIAGIPKNTHIIPIINRNSKITVGVELYDGTKIYGQHEISHPSKNGNNLNVNKENENIEPLLSPIKRLFYLNEDGQEILPKINPNVIKKLKEQETIIYSMGSLYTSNIF